MLRTYRLLVAFVVVVLLASVQAWAQASGPREPDDAGSEQTDVEPESESEGQPPDLEELQRRLDVLAEEVERLRSGEEETVELTPEQIRALGLAPSAARTYERSRGVSIAGYGEMLFERFSKENQAGDPSGKTNQFDFLRAIIYAGYRFNDQFLFNSEIEIEHADEIFVEFAYIDYLVHENLGIRGGILLLPMGLVNEFHEPTVFFGAERPVTETLIIPSTWRENGGGARGRGWVLASTSPSTGEGGVSTSSMG